MQTKPTLKLITLCFLSAASGFAAFGQGTAFTYQGRLDSSGTPAPGIYDLRFTIYDSTNNPGVVVAGPLTNSTTGIRNVIGGENHVIVSPSTGNKFFRLKQ